jgi:hypothetical protein
MQGQGLWLQRHFTDKTGTMESGGGCALTGSDAEDKSPLGLKRSRSEGSSSDHLAPPS